VTGLCKTARYPGLNTSIYVQLRFCSLISLTPRRDPPHCFCSPEWLICPVWLSAAWPTSDTQHISDYPPGTIKKCRSRDFAISGSCCFTIGLTSRVSSGVHRIRESREFSPPSGLSVSAFIAIIAPALGKLSRLWFYILNSARFRPFFGHTPIFWNAILFSGRWHSGLNVFCALGQGHSVWITAMNVMLRPGSDLRQRSTHSRLRPRGPDDPTSRGSGGRTTDPRIAGESFDYMADVAPAQWERRYRDETDAR
jgi:hypothetical protein